MIQGQYFSCVHAIQLERGGEKAAKGGYWAIEYSFKIAVLYLCHNLLISWRYKLILDDVPRFIYKHQKRCYTVLG